MRNCLGIAVLTLCCRAVGAQDAPAPIASLDSAWASIGRTYFDTALVNGAWRTAYDSIRRSLGDAPTDAAVRASIRKLIAVPNASHFALIPADALPSTSSPSTGTTPGTTGIEIRMIGDTAVVWRVAPGSAAERAGIRAGSTLTHVDTLAIDVVRSRLTQAFPDDRRKAALLAAAFANARMSGASGDTARFTLRVGRRRATPYALARTPLAGESTRFGNLPPIVVRTVVDSVQVRRGRRALNIPVLTFSAWFPVIAPALNQQLFALRSAPAVIIDLRGNPGGVVGMLGGVAGHFTDSAVNLGVMRGRGATLNLRSNPRLVSPTGEQVDVFSGPVAILVDPFTASTSEFFSAGMQALGRARIFGDTSAGQALPALMARLPNGDVLMHPIADHVDAGGRRVEGRGVVPDEVTPLSRRDLLDGRDAALDAARAWLARTLP
jgi:carboxyl-terminal processing protease